MLRKDDLATVRIRKTLKIAVEDWISTEYAKSLGFSSASNFMTIAAREALMKYSGPNFTDLNRYETNYELFDTVIDKKVNVTIGRRERGLKCLNCDSFKCEHILFIWSHPTEIRHLQQLKFLNPYLFLFNKSA